jgi:hypothetical protein
MGEKAKFKEDISVLLQAFVIPIPNSEVLFAHGSSCAARQIAKTGF